MNALVTGATGFIGRRLVTALLRRGVRVRALALPGENVRGIFPAKVRVVRGDVTDPEAVRAAVKGCDTIFHLAAVVSDWGEKSHHTRVTVGGTIRVMAEAARAKARVLLASSVVVYGSDVGRDVCGEDHPFGPNVGAYSASKQLQEKLAWEFSKDSGVKLTVIRPTNVYGPGSKPWVIDVAAQLKSGLPSLVSGGGQNAGLCHVDNLAELFTLAAFSSKAVNRVYNASDGSDITWARYFSDVAKTIGAPAPRSVPMPFARIGTAACEAFFRTLKINRRPPLTAEALNLVGSHHRVPIERARKELGYAPKVSYAEGLAGVERFLSTLPA